MTNRDQLETRFASGERNIAGEVSSFASESSSFATCEVVVKGA